MLGARHQGYIMPFWLSHKKIQGILRMFIYRLLSRFNNERYPEPEKFRGL